MPLVILFLVSSGSFLTLFDGFYGFDGFDGFSHTIKLQFEEKLTYKGSV